MVRPAPQGVERVQVQEWKVNPDRSQMVSRGFTVTLEVPQLTSGDLKTLIEKHRIDSWYFQIRRGSEVLQRVSVPLSISGRQHRSLQFIVQYAASAISMRFANSLCPGFNHRKIMTTPTIVQAPQGSPVLTLSPLNESRLTAPIQAFEIRPTSINGGHSLMGTYSFDMAYFDTREKSMRSNLVTLTEAVQVTSERDVEIRGCENYKIPDAPTNQGLDEFKFGR